MDSMNNYENYNTVNEVSQGAPKKTNGFAIAGMVLGIVSIPAACCFALIGVLIGIVGLIFSILGQIKGKSGMGLAGIICSAIGLVFGLANMILGFVMAASGTYASMFNF